MASSNFVLRRVESTIVLSKRKRKRIAPHQHLSDFIAMVLLLSGNLLQKFSDIRMLESDSPKLLWQTVGTAIFILESHQQRFPTVFIRRAALWHIGQLAAKCDDFFADPLGMPPFFL